MGKLLLSITAAIVSFSDSNAAIFTQWTYNGSGGSELTSTGSGSFSRIGGVRGGLVRPGSDWDQVGTYSSYGYNLTGFPAANNNNQQVGLQFTVSTAGWRDIVISWDQKSSETSSGLARVQYTLDVSVSTPTWVNADLFPSTSTGWLRRSADLKAISGANNNANFGLRIVSEYGTATGYIATNPAKQMDANGSWTFDLVTFSGELQPVPEPSTWIAIICVGVVILLHERRGLVRLFVRLVQ